MNYSYNTTTMFKIIALSVCLNLFLNFAKGEIDEECIRKALAEGVPSLDIPTHNPYHVEDFETTETIFGMTENQSYANVTWSNIPYWNLTVLEKYYEDETMVSYDYNLHWDYFNFAGYYDITFYTGWFEYRTLGNFTVDIKDVNWNGTFEVLKPTNDSLGQFTNITLKWETGEITSKFYNENAESTEESLNDIPYYYISRDNTERNYRRYMDSGLLQRSML